MGAGTAEKRFRPRVAPRDLRSEDRAMATTQSSVENATDDRRIDPDRFARACTEAIETTATAPFQYDVAHDGETYVVDLEVGHCGCKDHEFRGDELVCKHQCAAAIAHCYRDVRNTELVARVLAHARASGCPHGYAGCPGPTGPGLPCEDCIRSVGAGHWVVWCRVTNHDDWLAADTTVDTGEGVATDGGERVKDTTRSVSPCPGCGSLTVGDTCGRDRCEGADEIDETPL